jgi:hypothetical protein
MTKICVATNYELLQAPQVATWNTLARELAERNVQLVLLTNNGNADLEFVYLVIPYALEGFDKLNIAERPEVARIEGMLAIEALWQHPYLPDESRRGAKACRGFYQRLLAALEPDCVLIWNTLSAHSRILQLLCHEEEIPVFSFERGQLPGTFLIDTLRNNSASELNTSFVLDTLIADYKPDGALLARYREWYLRARPDKYVRSGHDSVAALEEARESGKPVVTVFGQALGAGLLPRTDALARRNFPDFDSVGEVLNTLAGVRDWKVAFRDHPINVGLQKGTDLPGGALRVEEAPLLRVLELTDVAVIIGCTSVLYEALLLAKPVLVVGNTPMARFAPYYTARGLLRREARGLALMEALSSALAGGWEGIRERADRALSFLLEHALVATHADVPAAHGLADLAAFIATFDLRRARTLEDRIRDLEVLATEV